MKNVFKFRDDLIQEYGIFSRSFTRIAASDILSEVDRQYDQGRYWPEPLIQINPNYQVEIPVQYFWVFCDMGSDIGDVFREMEECGMADFEDFTTLDAAESDMWCCCKPDLRKHPFPVDTQVGWLKGEYRDGTVWVWFQG